MSQPPTTGPSARSYTLIAAIVYLAAVAVACAAAYTLIQRAPTPDAQSGAAADDAVQQALRLGKPVVAEFGANNCESCREMKPVLGALAREHGERMTVVDIDLLKTNGYAWRYKIQLMPTQVFFDAQGREIGRHMGKISGNEILARLNVSPTGRAP
jgi:thioredoxin 1